MKYMAEVKENIVGYTFNTFSCLGRDSWISSSKMPPMPFKSVCLSSFKRPLRSLTLNGGLNLYLPSGVTSILGLLSKAFSVFSHCFNNC